MALTSIQTGYISEGPQGPVLAGDVPDHGVDNVSDVRVTQGVSELRPLGEGPLEGLGHPVVEEGRVILRPDVVVVQDVEDPGHDGATSGGRVTVQGGAQAVQVNTDRVTPAHL